MCGTIGTLTPASVHLADRFPRLPRAAFLSFHPQTRGTPQHRFIRHRSVLRYFQASPNPCRLAAVPRRNGFVILRTDSSLPVTPHPASRRRSYLRLRSCGQLRQGLSPCKEHTLAGVHGSPSGDSKAIGASAPRLTFTEIPSLVTGFRAKERYWIFRSARRRNGCGWTRNFLIPRRSRRWATAMGSDSISRTLRRPSLGKRRGAPARKRFDLGPKSIVTQSPSFVRRLPDRIDVGLG